MEYEYILDVYLDKTPCTFNYKNKNYRILKDEKARIKFNSEYSPGTSPWENDAVNSVLDDFDKSSIKNIRYIDY